ncbi:putative receptor protein kinase ZmPK1 [Vitis vinifera]|uniref:Putative receptor protein kinase ZmPK1 n=1 Tax=Vitis vinifera TaxID=29760 RepID=A0A438DYN6_VITVI|nr:putative receptor protein kinase ZmPK1 [Vitis vinifera]
MLDCSRELQKQLPRTYSSSRENGLLRFMLWFACAIGGVEMICIVSVWCFLRKAHQNPIAYPEGYLLVATRFRRFTYTELKRAIQGVSEEIGRGGGGVVYKGFLSDHRVAAIKQLNVANEGEAKFLAENGSLAENLTSNTLDWQKRFDIAPQNILLDPNHRPKVADFGLSKLVNRGGVDNSSFSRIRGTRGYMASEWVLNLPSTSKVDVFSYGIVVLEMITVKNPATEIQAVDGVRSGRKLNGMKLKTRVEQSCTWLNRWHRGASKVGRMGEREDERRNYKGFI